MREFCIRWSKRFFICSAAVLFLFCAGCGSAANRGKSTVRIGVGLYRSDDTFINNLRRELEQYAKEYEQESGTKIVLDIQAAKGNQSVQNRQVDRFVSLDCDVLCVNPVDRMAVSSIIDKGLCCFVILIQSPNNVFKVIRICSVKNIVAVVQWTEFYISVTIFTGDGKVETVS